MYSYNLRYNTYNTYNKYRFLLGGQAITYFSCTQSTCRNKVLHTSSWVQHVSHDFLTRKLRNYGLDAQTVRRIENYLGILFSQTAHVQSPFCQTRPQRLALPSWSTRMWCSQASAPPEDRPLATALIHHHQARNLETFSLLSVPLSVIYL